MTKENTKARCRWCDKNNIPLGNMVIFSFKPLFKMFTGVCNKCINSERAELNYHRRVLKVKEK